MVTHKSLCRTCMNFCAVEVETDGNRVLTVTGDHDNPVFHGYSCNKGRAQPELYAHPDRVTRPLRRTPDGGHVPVEVDQAIDDIGRRLRTILDQYGPRAIAVYQGTYGYLDNPANFAMIAAFMRAVGSKMWFSAATIDQAGKLTAPARHGSWMAPGVGSHNPDVALLIGKNPLVSHLSWCGSPGDMVKDIDARGASLIVIDPRRTETAKRATIHLQTRPGYDALLLAAMIRVILDEDLYDHDFVAENVNGLEELRRTVALVDPAAAAETAGVPIDDLTRAARLYARAQRAFGTAGTGANMTGDATLVEYLLLCLQSLCGFWLREGDTVNNATTLTPLGGQPAKAQASPPRPPDGTAEPSRVRGLGQVGPEMPTATAAEEILLPGEGQVRALLSLGGNPVAAWPDQLTTVEAFRQIDLLVQTDIVMSATAKLADYVIAMKLPYEQPGTTFINDYLAGHGADMGMRYSYAQYTPAIVTPPADVLDHPTFIYRVARAMGLQLEIYPSVGYGGPGEIPWVPDMSEDLDLDELIDFMHRGSRVTLAEVRKYPSGALFPSSPPVLVGPKDPGWTGRLDVANEGMMQDIAAVVERIDEAPGYSFRLTSRRMPHVQNSPNVTLPANRPNYNPAFMHPDDLADLGLAPNDMVEICSPRASVTAVVAADGSLRRGLVSMSHAWGDSPDAETEELPGSIIPGAPTSRLIDVARFFDRHSGQPQMSNIPVSLRPIPTGAR